MKKIVRGNDFVLRIPVVKIVSGEQVAFPLPACESITVNLVSAYKRVALEYSIDAAEDNVLLAKVEGDVLSCGSYALEVKGKFYGSDWRSNEYEQIVIVNNNASADTELGDVDANEDSVEIDTQVIVMGASTPALTPKGEWSEAVSYVRGDTVTHGYCAWWAEADNVGSEPTKENSDWVVLVDMEPVKDEIQGDVNNTVNAAVEKVEAATERADEATEAASDATEKAKEVTEAVNTTNEAATEAEALRAEAEKGRMASEDARKAAEEGRVSAEAERVTSETERKSAETSRDEAEADRCDKEDERISAEASRVKAEEGRVTAENKRVSEFDETIKNAEAATADAQDTADHPDYVGDDNYVYRWSKAAKTYEKTDIYVKGEQHYTYMSINEEDMTLHAVQYADGDVSAEQYELDDDGVLHIKL